MKLQFFDALSTCRGGELLGVTKTPSGMTTNLIILKDNGDIEEFDIRYIHKCKVVTEVTPEKKHRQ